MSNPITAKANTTYIFTKTGTLILPDTLKAKERVLVGLVPKYSSNGIEEYYLVTINSINEAYTIPSIMSNQQTNTYKQIKFTRRKDSEGFSYRILSPSLEIQIN
jgi:hypothetical protein